jgi:hypothetical protein
MPILKKRLMQQFQLLIKGLLVETILGRKTLREAIQWTKRSIPQRITPHLLTPCKKIANKYYRILQIHISKEKITLQQINSIILNCRSPWHPLRTAQVAPLPINKRNNSQLNVAVPLFTSSKCLKRLMFKVLCILNT